MVMAAHMKYKLPSFKVTKRSAGFTQEATISRGQIKECRLVEGTERGTDTV